MRILVAYRAIPQSPGWATGDSLVRAFRALGHDAKPYAKVYQKDEFLDPGIDTNSWRPQLLVYLECNDNDPQYPELADLHCGRIYWEFDTSMHRDFSRRFVTAMGFHKVYLANHRELGTIPGAYYLPYGVDAAHFRAPDKKSYRSGAALLGHAFPARVDFCKEAGVQLVQGLYNTQYAKALQLLAISVHNHDSGGDGLLVGRVWESLGCGALLLTKDSPLLRKHFTPGLHVVTYADAADCKAKVEYYLAHRQAREDIAAAGHEEAMRHHTYLCRARAILAGLE